MKNLNITAILIISTLVFSCNSKKCDYSISKEEMMKIVKECDNKFRVGTQTKNAKMLTDIYSDSAQYVQPDKAIITGKAEIGKEWQGFVNWTAFDLVLNIADVRGNREIIYETGNGYTLYLNEKGDSAKINFNYVNVWRLQNDGSYKLEIDTYTPVNK